MTRTIPLAQYVFKRLGQLNCQSIHGVPGDFFLRALDHIRPSGLKWIGNANELCAGYAADGYARAGSQLTRHKYAPNRTSEVPMVGAFMTTYGVGELSAINAVAGSYSESVPVVHLVSTPSRAAMRKGNPHRLVHHTMADDRMEVYAEMARHVTCSQASLHRIQNATEAAETYDEVLENAVRQSKPVYVSLSSDQWELPLPGDMLEKRLNLTPPPNNPEVEAKVVDQLLGMLRTSQRPLIIADGLSYPLHLQSEINELISVTAIPSMSFMSGKGIINETLPSWSPALPNTTDYSRNADLVWIFGPLLSDTNTARWSAIPHFEDTVMFNLDSVELPGQKHHSLRSKALLQALISRLKETPITQPDSSKGQNSIQTPGTQTPCPNDRIAQDALWPAMSSYIKAEDTMLLANGTPLIGGRDIRLQSGSQVIASGIWNAIGSLLPAAQGVAAAKRDHNLPGRTILLEGDGSFQVTCQSISDIIRYKLDITIFIANNAGYTYERWLNGMDAEYNDVPSWRYVEAARFFGAREDDPEYPLFMKRVETWSELQHILADERASDGKGLKIIDVVMDPKDVPEASKPGLLRASEALKSF